MTIPASYKSLIRHFQGQSQQIQDYLGNFENLIQSYSYEVTVAYCFFKLEQAYNRTLYGGARKLHKVQHQVLTQVLDRQHLSREGFLTFYNVIFGKAVTTSTQSKIKFAEKIRDRIIHGKSVPNVDSRRCLAELLDFATELDKEVQAAAGFSPFADMRGLNGSRTSLDKATTRWVLRGMGFSA